MGPAEVEGTVSNDTLDDGGTSASSSLEDWFAPANWEVGGGGGAIVYFVSGI
jgi:hypothetical protein